MPKISVIVPVYNVEKYLSRCIDSILAQTFMDFELILIDDGSSDNCGKICDEYARKDERIVVIHQKNGGRSVARNSGIDWENDNSNSEWLCFIDSDDWIHPQYLEILYFIANDSGCDMSVVNFSTHTAFCADFTRVNDCVNYQIIDSEKFYIEKDINSIAPWGRLVLKNYYSQLRFPAGKEHEDAFVTYRIVFAVTRIAFFDQPLYYYFENPNGFTRISWIPKKLDLLDALEEQLEYLRFDYKKAYIINKDKYFDYLLRLRNNIIPESGIENPEKYQKIVTKRLRRALWRYHAFPPNKYGDCYVTVYPFLVKIRFIIKK